MWSHDYFEARLEDECARAAQGGRPFAVARVHAPAKSPMDKVERTLVELLRAVDVLATYSDEEYEVLLVETAPNVAQALAAEIESRLLVEGVRAKVALACYPQDGRTPESLVARAGQTGKSGTDPAAKNVIREGALARLEPLVNKVAASNISVLVLGETGVGKEVLARMIHERSPRADKPLVCLNCASLSESLLESELFGHEKGAFTGAVTAKAGLLESAGGGTAFLDEVGEMPLSLQAKLLRVLEQREVLRVGAVTPRAIDVRFVAATNRDLDHEISAGRFRQDLYFRLNGFAIVIPPLRERTEEIEALAKHFVALACKQSGRRPIGIGSDALEVLRSYEWPGNIRELKNVIDRAVLLCSGGRSRRRTSRATRWGASSSGRSPSPTRCRSTTRRSSPRSPPRWTSRGCRRGARSRWHRRRSRQRWPKGESGRASSRRSSSVRGTRRRRRSSSACRARRS